MLKLYIVAIVLSVAAMASVNGAVSRYGYTFPPYWVGVVPAVSQVGSKVESKVAEEKVDSIEAVPVYQYSHIPYYPHLGLGLLSAGPLNVPKVESKSAEGKVDSIAPLSSYLIDPLYASYYHGYPYVGYPYSSGLRLVRDADKNIERIEEPVAEQSGEVRE